MAPKDSLFFNRQSWEFLKIHTRTCIISFKESKLSSTFIWVPWSQSHWSPESRSTLLNLWGLFNCFSLDVPPNFVPDGCRCESPTVQSNPIQIQPSPEKWKTRPTADSSQPMCWLRNSKRPMWYRPLSPCFFALTLLLSSFIPNWMFFVSFSKTFPTAKVCRTGREIEVHTLQAGGTPLMVLPYELWNQGSLLYRWNVSLPTKFSM